MKVFFILLFCSFSLLKIDISELRKQFPEANTDVAVVDDLYDQLSFVSLSENPKLIAYKGAVLALKSKNSKTVEEKKSFFRESVEFLEQAIKNGSEDIEIRCLRLSVQENAPKVVRYSQNIDEDKLFILKHYHDQKDTQLKVFIKNYVLGSSSFTEEEKRSF